MTTEVRKSPSGKNIELVNTPRGYPPAQARYVDYRENGFPDDIPTEEQDGSAAFPFNNLQAAADSIGQKSEPAMIILYPGDTFDQTKKDLNLDGFVAFHIQGLNVSNDQGYAEVGDVTGDLIHTTFENINLASFAGNPAASQVNCRGAGQMSNITAQFLTFSGPLHPSLLGAGDLEIVDAVITSEMVGGGGVIRGCSALRARITNSWVGSIGTELTLTGAAGNTSFFTVCSNLQVIADPGALVWIDSWSADNAPGFTVFTGPVPTVL